jgi:EAL domain-containing protein (putative c-di-GMP-specific phosphodiesterase class I)
MIMPRRRQSTPVAPEAPAPVAAPPVPVPVPVPAPVTRVAGETQASLVLEDRLREAVEAGRFHLNYQPVVSLTTGRPVAVEALLRWDSEVGPVPPGRFVPALEGMGLIVPVGNWVLEEACRQARRWDDDRPELGRLGMAVNISARQLDQAGFAATVRRALEASRLPASRLCLEITNAFLIREPQAAWAELRQLKGLGVRLWIDDFGTANSSISFVKSFSVDGVKVDRSFVAGLGKSEEDDAIVQAIIGLAHALRLETVAEGVETEEQLEILRSLGCDFAQGYYFTHPGSADAVADSILGGWTDALDH